MKSKGHTVSFINRFFNSFFSYAFLVMLFVVSFVFNTSSASATSTLTVSIPFDRISLNLVGVNNEPTFAKSNDASFTVSTTNSTGYTVNIKSNTTGGNDGSGVLLLNGNDSNYTISSIGGNDFPVGGINESTYRTSSTYNNTWGYKPSMIDSSSNSNFLPSPDATGDTINVTNCANGTENTTCTNMTDTYSIAIGAKVDSTVRIGSYSNTFVILAVANAIPYTIIYDDNAGNDAVTDMPNPSTVNDSTYAETVAISSNVPRRDGYNFNSWCTVQTNDGQSCNDVSGISYSPNDSWAIDQASNNNALTLYAVWTISSITITLTNTNATTNGSTSATANYGSSVLSSITAPVREYSFSGFTKTNSAYNATVSATTTKTYTYNFDGWYTASSGGYKVINADGTLIANAPNGTATLTNASSQWISTSNDTTLYAHWATGTNQALPTITQTNSTYGNGNCYWSTSNSTTGSQVYASGATISAPTSGATLYGVCKFPIKITFDGSGVSSVAVRSGSVTGTLIGTVSSSGGSVSNLAYGTNYYLVPTYTSGNELSSWAKNSTYGTLSSTSAANPYITIGTTSSTGAVGVTITSKKSKLWFQNATSTNCGQTMYDNRGTSTYKNVAYTTAKIGSLCWMTRNLDLPGGTTITSSDSNITASSYTLPTSSASGFSDTTAQNVYNSGSTSCGSNRPCYSYYTYIVATAGGGASSDICPKGWRLPTQAELSSLASTYTSGSTLTASPFLAVYAGYYNYLDSTFNYGGSYGLYWSSTANGSTTAYYLTFGGINASVSATYKGCGYSVRCVAKS